LVNAAAQAARKKTIMPDRCPHCGAQLPGAGDAFCPECRGELEPTAAPPLQSEVIGLEGLTNEEVLWELRNGAKFVVYQYCVSLLIVTLYRSSEVHFIRSNESAVLRGMKYTLISLVLGWWGFPFGPIYTVAAIAINLSGGRNVTPTTPMHAPG
jgi:hypothetical protein